MCTGEGVVVIYRDRLIRDHYSSASFAGRVASVS